MENRLGVSKITDQVALANSPYNEEMVKTFLHSALLQAGLGQQDLATPLADIIQPGMSVLLKPNWVLHTNLSGQGMECMVTQPNFILAALREVLACHPGRVLIGDAPVQSCQFDALISDNFHQKVVEMATCPVEIMDFRRTITGQPVLSQAANEEHYVLFDLGTDSLLEPISRPTGRFRVTSYDPRQLAKTHQPGRHQYLLSRAAFEADIIINLPKLKTHKKAGLTAALKNLVGINGNKDYLPHHRLGGSALGGDCYPGVAPVKRAIEFCLDRGNRVIGQPAYSHWMQLTTILKRVQHRLGERILNLEGSWYGNDTVWRMSLDLNRLLLYGKADGTLSDSRLRTIYSLTDGIIAGQGDGPLASTPLALGIVTFGASSPFADLLHAALLHLDGGKIPLVREAFGGFRYPLTNTTPHTAQVYWEGRILSISEAAQSLGRSAIPPTGWKNHIEMNTGFPGGSQ